MIVDTDAHDVYRDKAWLEGVIEEIQRRVG
jgi:hypothetical protein